MRTRSPLSIRPSVLLPVLVLLLGVQGITLSCHRQSAAVAPAPPPAAPAAVGVAQAVHVQPRVSVRVTEEGFVPDHIPAQVGKPITLVVTRKTDRTCAREILFKGQEGKTDLPLDKEVEVTYTPKAAGPVPFGCAMGMMVGGTLDVR